MSVFKAADQLVGKYDLSGKKIEDGAFIGSKRQVEAIQDLYRNHSKGEGTPIDITPKWHLRPTEPIAKTVEKTAAPAKKIKKVKKVEAPVPQVVTAMSPARYIKLEDMETSSQTPVGEVAEEEPVAIDQDHDMVLVPVKTVPQYTVQFTNGFGTIKVKVLAVIKEDFYVILVFANEDAVTFVPKIGDEFQVELPDGSEFQVVFPGIMFGWTDQVQRVMILGKVLDEHEPT